jgi:hypothetical protein
MISIYPSVLNFDGGKRRRLAIRHRISKPSAKTTRNDSPLTTRDSLRANNGAPAGPLGCVTVASTVRRHRRRGHRGIRVCDPHHHRRDVEVPPRRPGVIVSVVTASLTTQL